MFEILSLLEVLRANEIASASGMERKCGRPVSH